MRLRGLYFVAPLFLGSVVALIGCASKPPAKPQQSAAAKALAVDSAPGVAAPTTRPAPSHDLLEAQVAAYAAKLEQVLARQKAEAQARAAAASTQPATEPVAD